MIVDFDCYHCDGLGEVTGTAPNARSRMVSHDDLSPDDYSIECPVCHGHGTLEWDAEEDMEDDCDD